MSGLVYKATNIINNNIYIGKTLLELEKRKQRHFIMSNNNSNLYFHRAIHKYGKENFQWEILCETDSESKLNILEKFYIACYRKMGKVYNLTNGGEGASGLKMSENHNEKLKNINKGNTYRKGKSHSKETKEKISKSLKAKKNIPWNKGTKGIMKSWSKGKTGVYSEEVIQRNREWHKGKLAGEKHHFYGKHLSEEHKNKIRNALKGRKKGIPWTQARIDAQNNRKEVLK
jgi:group I intron endonuclease